MVKETDNPNTPKWTDLDVAFRIIANVENAFMGFPPDLDILIRGNSDKESYDAKVSQDYKSAVSEAIFDLWKSPKRHKYIILSNLDELFVTSQGACIIETHHVARVANHLVDLIKTITDNQLKVMVMLPFMCGSTDNLDAFLDAMRLLVNILVTNPDLVSKWTREVTIFQTSEWLLEVCTSASKKRYNKDELLRIKDDQIQGWTQLGVYEVSARLSENLKTWISRDLNPESKLIHVKQPVSLADLSKVLSCQYVVSPTPSKGTIRWNKSTVSQAPTTVVPNRPPLDKSAADWAKSKSTAKLKGKAAKRQLGQDTKTKKRSGNQPNALSASPPRKRYRKNRKGGFKPNPNSANGEPIWDNKPKQRTQSLGL